jgi:hypothetical protein
MFHFFEVVVPHHSPSMLFLFLMACTNPPPMDTPQGQPATATGAGQPEQAQHQGHVPPQHGAPPQGIQVAQVPVDGVANAPAEVPRAPVGKERWRDEKGYYVLPEIMWGVLELERAGMPLTAKQAEPIRDHLVEMKAVTQRYRIDPYAQKNIRSILTDQQMQWLEQRAPTALHGNAPLSQSRVAPGIAGLERIAGIQDVEPAIIPDDFEVAADHVDPFWFGKYPHSDLMGLYLDELQQQPFPITQAQAEALLPYMELLMVMFEVTIDCYRGIADALSPEQRAWLDENLLLEDNVPGYAELMTQIIALCEERM